MRRIIFIAAAMLAAVSAHAKLEIKEPYSDGMVLQQKTECLIKGHSNPGAHVKVITSWNNASYGAKADKNGVWKVYVSTPEASYDAYSIHVSGEGSTLDIHNVLIGEVWIASGQSNMEMPIKGFANCPVEGSADVISSPSQKDRIRYFSVATHPSYEPLYDFAEYSGWLDVDSSTVGDMSATAYFFAAKIQPMLDVPIGVLIFPRGGASVESWLPKETLAAWGDDLSEEALQKQNEWSRSYVMYNGMQIPAQEYTAKGFIWYQGCSNVGMEDRFVFRMTELIRQWRNVDWKDTDNKMPFYMCEIAPYNYPGDQQGHGALLRQAQHELARALENCECIVTNDLVYPYEINNIHPSRKKAVGERLAFLALNRDYGFDKIACYSPEAVNATVNPQFGKMIAVEMENCENGINRNMDIEGLEIVTSDGTVIPVKEASCFGGRLIIRYPEDIVPAEVRYGWGDFKPGNLQNVEGLPFTPFCIKIK
ncbi:MAG: sialate O-acetylesterase [Bacteroidales bacterium]|nr:sialate O-acetylesterase [Bacteroidales bacterium]